MCAKIAVKPEVANHNIIAFGTKIEGNIYVEADIRIEGELRGNIEALNSKVIVGHTGTIFGSISAQNIDVMGFVEGNIAAEVSVSLKATANVKGNLSTAVISIEPNAIFDGECKMPKETTK